MDDVVLNAEDIEQQYYKNIVLYNDRPVLVQATAGDMVTIWDLEKQVYENVRFSLKTFKASVSRLGMVNIMGSVLFMARIPVRKMQIGLNRQNTTINYLPVHYPEGSGATTAHLSTLKCKELVDVLKGVYPTFKQALKQVRDAKSGACAFDRQFTVDANGCVFYKLKKVGLVKLTAKSPEDIVFENQYKYLSILLEGNHEKTIGISCS